MARNLSDAALNSAIVGINGVSMPLFYRYMLAITAVCRKSGGYSIVKTLTDTATAQLEDGIILCAPSGSSMNLTLPPTSEARDKILTIKNIGISGKTVILVGTVDGTTSPSLSSGQYTTIICNGSTWYKVG